MTNEFDKPFRTYEELLSILESRNVVIEDRTDAIKVLSDYSYYYLINGFKSFFKTSDDDVFDEPVKFNDFITMFLIENEFNSIILKYTLIIERSLKSKVSYRISDKYGVYTDYDSDDIRNNRSDYFFRGNYYSGPKRDNVLKRIKGKIKKNIKGKKTLSVSHYVENHNHLPLWIAINCLPLGDVIVLYKILKQPDKTYVSENIIHSSALDIEQKKEFLSQGLELLQGYRNKIAHGERVYSSNLHEKLPKKLVVAVTGSAISNSDYLKGFGKNDMFAVMIAITVLTRDLTRELFLNEISYTLDVSEKLYISGKPVLDYLGLPKNLMELLSNIK